MPRNTTPIVVSTNYTPPVAGQGRAAEIEALPRLWRNALLAIGRAKQPVGNDGRALADWLHSPVPSVRQLCAAPAVGLRTGAISETLCLDFDGPEAWTTFRELFGGTARDLLPRTLAWTSGKAARCQIALRVAPEHQPLLKNKRRKVGALELRWNGQQSVLMGFHPETNGYRWLPGCSPFEQELADFPLDLLPLVPSSNGSGQVARRVEKKSGEQVTELVVPLEQFITLRSRWLIENGSVEGQCNEDGIRLSLDLVGAEAWLKEQGVGVERDARTLFEDYCQRCPETINGRPFDQRAMEGRFEGALKRSPLPPTPEEKLRERLAYHRRMTRRATRQLEAVA